MAKYLFENFLAFPYHANYGSEVSEKLSLKFSIASHSHKKKQYLWCAPLTNLQVAHQKCGKPLHIEKLRWMIKLIVLFDTVPRKASNIASIIFGVWLSMICNQYCIFLNKLHNVCTVNGWPNWRIYYFKGNFSLVITLTLAVEVKFVKHFMQAVKQTVLKRWNSDGGRCKPPKRKMKTSMQKTTFYMFNHDLMD